MGNKLSRCSSNNNTKYIKKKIDVNENNQPLPLRWRPPTPPKKSTTESIISQHKNDSNRKY